jgi:hypothetical protein
VTCVASFGALCPATLGASMTLPSLGPGRSLTFTYAVDVPAASRGNIDHQVQVSSTTDTDLSDNAATVTAIAIDGRNGAYKGLCGERPGLRPDDRLRRPELHDDGRRHAGAEDLRRRRRRYIVAGTQRLRAAADLVVGNHDFGSGLLPYVAARRFGTTLVDAVFNLATRNVAADGSATTHPGTARISGNVLSICQTDVSVQSTQNCPVS